MRTLSGTEHDFFAGMELQKNWYMTRAKRLKLRKHDIIYSEGTGDGSCFYIESGVVRVFYNAENGKEATLFVHHLGTFFGLLEAVGVPRYEYTAQALSSSTIYALDSKNFNNMLKYDILFSQKIIQLVNRHLQYSLAQRAVLMTYPVMQQLLKTLAYLYEDLQSRTSVFEKFPLVTLHHSQAHIATMIGSTQATVSRLLQQLQSEGILSLSRERIRILNASVLLHKAAHPWTI